MAEVILGRGDSKSNGLPVARSPLGPFCQAARRSAPSGHALTAQLPWDLGLM